ncbi:unnamed protein product [Lactuca saligna]|uniref:Arabidopsis retrotransposon Orf1 C-terminal domain-containing protein n=1 Tax=Lactuca saligna TaxID=75948 RepID=A0AA35V6Z3_LACSI|nr:unnamed protein product [Lactuca saligna]
MSRSRKRTAADRGKAPARNQNDAPDIPTFQDAKAAKNYMKSLPRNVSSTKFMCKPTLISLGVLEGFTQLFRNIGRETLLNLMAHTHELPTREFLADCGLDKEKKKSRIPTSGGPKVYWFCNNKRHIGLAFVEHIHGF